MYVFLSFTSYNASSQDFPVFTESIFYRKKLLQEKKKEDLKKAKELAKEQKKKVTKQKPAPVDFSSILSINCIGFRKIEISKLFFNLLFFSCVSMLLTLCFSETKFKPYKNWHSSFRT